METYFNYFTEIEEHFQRRRGTLLLLSPLDWALMETWKDAGIPLEAVLRGIDATFDKWERRPRRFQQGEWPRLLLPGSAGVGGRIEGSRRWRGSERSEEHGTGPLCRGRVPESQRRRNSIRCSCRRRRKRWRKRPPRPCALWRVRCRRTGCCQWKTWSDD